MGNVLALDLSTKRSGWAIKTEKGLEYGAISASSPRPESRIIKMREGIKELLLKYKVDTIVIEEVRQDGYNNHTAKLLLWLQGIVTVAAFERDAAIKIEYIHPSSWRSKLKIQGKAVKREQQKAIDIKWANEHYNLSLGMSQDDEADAIGILSSYEITNPEPKIVDGFEFA